MASTYSTSLRLELMATGDQSGTWGTTTNTNLGTLLEQAITGYLSVAQGDVANLTLSTVNGGSDQARNAIIRITGALTATRNVVVQTPAKVYTIANDTTGGFSIVAKTTAGTGVSIPPGAMINVYSDGTNVVAGQNYFNGQIGGAVWLDAGATVGPNFDLFRDSTSPAVSDILGRVTFNGRDSAGNKQEYASIESTVISPTSTTEAGSLDFYRVVAGARTLGASLGTVMAIPAASTAGGSQIVVRSDAAVQADQETGTSTTTFVSPAVQQFHPSAVKCWGYATYSAGTPTLQASYNVTSIADTATGTLTVTIGTDFSSANYSTVVSAQDSTNDNATTQYASAAAGSIILLHYENGNVLTDPANISWQLTGDQ